LVPQKANRDAISSARFTEVCGALADNSELLAA
jgi:hypothetical protein